MKNNSYKPTANWPFRERLIENLRSLHHESGMLHSYRGLFGGKGFLLRKLGDVEGRVYPTQVAAHRAWKNGFMIPGRTIQRAEA